MDYWRGCTKDLAQPGLEIHRFDMGKRVCRCGKYVIGPPVLRQQGWRQFAHQRAAQAESLKIPTFEGPPEDLLPLDTVEELEAL